MQLYTSLDTKIIIYHHYLNWVSSGFQMEVIEIAEEILRNYVMFVMQKCMNVRMCMCV